MCLNEYILNIQYIFLFRLHIMDGRSASLLSMVTDEKLKIHLRSIFQLLTRQCVSPQSSRWAGRAQNRLSVINAQLIDLSQALSDFIANGRSPHKLEVAAEYLGWALCHSCFYRRMFNSPAFIQLFRKLIYMSGYRFFFFLLFSQTAYNFSCSQQWELLI